MTSLADRLRGVLGPPVAGSPVRHVTDARMGEGAAERLGGAWVEAAGQRFLVVDRRYPAGHRHGLVSVADGLPPGDGWPSLSLLAATSSGRGLFFVDLETTGLAGGAGTYAFLVGCGWFDGEGFHTRQFFLSSFAAERTMLEAVAQLARASETVVTYNGKSFDVPLIETRCALHRLGTPLTGMPHIDMLHPARRLWRSRDGAGRADDRTGDGAGAGCRLTTLEQVLLGYEREGDVPGFEIPSRYFQYVRSGDAAPLAAVLEHNRLDLLSLGLLTTRAARLLQQGADGAASGREALGLGWLYERAGRAEDALACFARAAGIGPAHRPEALRASAVLARRLRRYEEAATAWQRLLGLSDCPPQIVREASEALAVHHEHRLRDPLSARRFALRSLRMEDRVSKRPAAEHRLARLNRKLGRPATEASPLF